MNNSYNRKRKIFIGLLFGMAVLFTLSQVSAQLLDPRSTRSLEFTVNSTADVNDFSPGDGVCSTGDPATQIPPVCTLRAAITETNFTDSADIINLPASAQPYILSLVGTEVENNNNTGDLDINKSVTIIGGDRDTTLIQGDGLDGFFIDNVIDVFTPNVPITINISNVTISGYEHKRATSVLLREGQVNLNLDNVALINNFRGLANMAGTATITNSLIAFNHNDGLPNNSGTAVLQSWMGAGIYNRGITHVINSEISNNLAEVYKPSTVPEAPNGTNFSGNGAGIFNERFYSGSTPLTPGVMTLTDVNIENNTADLNGGGIYNKGDGSLTIHNSFIRNNIAGAVFGVTNQAAVIWPHGSGGGLYNVITSATTITAKVSIHFSEITGNTADAGGGIANRTKGVVVIHDTLIANNNATNPPDTSDAAPYNFSPVWGGGGIINGDTNSTITIYRSSIQDNNAYAGGGALNWNGSILTIYESTFMTNYVQPNNSIRARGGGIYSGGNTYNTNVNGVTPTFTSAQNSKLTLVNSTVSGNHVDAGLPPNEWTAEGGGIWNMTSLELRNVTIAENKSGRPAESPNPYRPGIGGGIYQQDYSSTIPLIRVYNTVMDNNISGLQGNECVDYGLELISGGHNMLTDADTCETFKVPNTQHTDFPNIDPLLGNIGDYGGPAGVLRTYVHSLQPNSPAIDNGNDATCTSIDQRTYVRVNACDIGSYEISSVQATATSTGTITATFTATFTGTATRTPTNTRTPTITRTPSPTWTPGGPTATPSQTWTPGGPTATLDPVTQQELLINRDMEINIDAKRALPDGWSALFRSRDKLKCGDLTIVKSGACAFKFQGVTGEMARLRQFVTADKLVLINVGDMLQVSGWIKRQNLRKGAVLRVVVKYTNKALGKDKGVFRIPKGTSEYELYTTTAVTVRGTIKNLRAEIMYTGQAGKFYVDDVSLVWTRAVAREGFMPLPPQR